MVTSQVRSSSVHAELARVLRVTTQAWGLTSRLVFKSQKADYNNP
jgi:hypothetical protein